MSFRSDVMERVGDRVAENNKTKDCNVSSKPQEPITMESPIPHESMRIHGPQNLPPKYGDTIEGSNNLGRFKTSLVGSENPQVSPYSIPAAETGIVVKELTFGNYKSSNVALGRSTRQAQPAHVHTLAGGSRCNALDEDSLPKNMDCMLSRVREQLAGMPPDRATLNNQSDRTPGEIAAYLRATGIKSSLSDASPIKVSQAKTLHTSNFSRLPSNETLRGKEVAIENPEAPSELGGGGIAGHNDVKMDYMTNSASFAWLKSSACYDMASSHKVDNYGPKPSHEGITLREWLKPRGGKKPQGECLLLFRQVVQLVDLAHSQGFALHDLRPSCFMLLASSKVTYSGSFFKKESDSTVGQGVNKKRPLGQVTSTKYRESKQQKSGVDMQYLESQPQLTSSCRSSGKTREDTGCSYLEFKSQNEFDDTTVHISRRQQPIIRKNRLEEKWYASPEEHNGRNSLFSSNIYHLGVLLFELLCWSQCIEVHSQVISNLHHRILPPKLLSEKPREVGFCLWLLQPEPMSRPTAREILKSELVCGIDEYVCKDDLSEYADNENDESEVLLHFLLSLKKQKQKQASKLVEDIGSLEEDISEAERRHLPRTSSVFSQVANEIDSQLHQVDPRSSITHSDTYLGPSTNDKRLMKNIAQLQDAYFSLRSQMSQTKEVVAVRSDNDLLKSRGYRSQVHNGNEKASESEESSDRIGYFFDGLSKFARYSKFENCGTVTNGDLTSSANVICSLSFDRDEEFIAAAGVSKRIKIFEFNAFTNDSIDVHYPLVELSNKSKLSCVCWNNYIKNYLASADYDGVVQIWDASTGERFSQYMEHQKRAWSVDFSVADPTTFASGSDDCSVKLWNLNEKSSVGTISNPANICCVQFSASSSHMLAFGSADYKIYCYDLRHARVPWCTLAGHQKAVSYVKFLDSETIVSASTDNTLKLWDLNKTSSTGLSAGACALTFSGHSNEKNFVGLSVSDGYIACGSETNEVFSYYRSLPMPITSYKFGSVDPISGHEIEDDPAQFVSSVCWRRKSNMLVAANSTGSMKLLQIV